MMDSITIGVVGNPNCGKTTLFNQLTGAKQRVGNWPGVTVDRKTGSYPHGYTEVEVVDTPGIYSLSACSIDEKVASAYVMSREYDLIVNIVDASNIERNLYLTCQLVEMGVSMIIALNMMDVAQEKELTINVEALAEKLGCRVVPMTASRGAGIHELKDAINEVAALQTVSSLEVQYPDMIVQAAEDIASFVRKKENAIQQDPFWISIKLLEDDELAMELAGAGVAPIVQEWQDEIEEELDEDADILIASARYTFISSVVASSVKKARQVSAVLSDKIDKIVLNKFAGLPIFFAAMYIMFMFTINFGGIFIDFFDGLFGVVCVDWYGQVLSNLGFPDLFVALIAGGVGGALQVMATFIPPIGFMFLALSFLEDSGYMARAAFVMDRAMRVIGLPGKAFIPMLVGFGCNVPAIMATRTMENQRDRTLTIAMNPFMSCGARLPVYALFAAAFFPAGGQNLVFALYVTGIGFAVLTGLVLKNTVLRGEISPFVMELPPYHFPSLTAVLLRTWDRLTAFLFRAGKVLVPVIVVLSLLNSMGTDGSFGNEDSDNSLLAAIGKKITPIFKPMGLTEDNWPATVGIFTGIFAKEAVVGTLDSLYESRAGQAQDVAAAEDEAESVIEVFPGIVEAFATIPANFMDLAGSLMDPLGLSVGDVSSFEAAAEELEISTGTFAMMKTLFGGTTAAIAYLLFVLLYFPCSAAIAAVYRETNLQWTLFVGGWTTGLAYFAATIYYQASTFSNDPVSAGLWIGSLLGIFLTIVIVMRAVSNERKPGYLAHIVGS